MFRDPTRGKARQAGGKQRVSSPHYMEMHTGAEDNGCDPLLAGRFASPVGNTKLHIVAGAGHQLGEEYLQAVLSKFLDVTLP